MAVKQHGRNLGRTPQDDFNIEFNSEVMPKPGESKLSAAECAALVETICATPGWWAQRVGDLHHRYVFCWRWQEPQTAVLFCYDQPSWWKLRSRIEKALGLTT